MLTRGSLCLESVFPFEGKNVYFPFQVPRKEAMIEYQKADLRDVMV
jgi:hypothetical protein